MADLFMPNQILKTSGPDLLRDLDLTDDELLYLLDLAAEVKQSPADYAQVLTGKSIRLKSIPVICASGFGSPGESANCIIMESIKFPGKKT